MIFLVVMPVVFGLANYVLPLQIGARDMAFRVSMPLVLVRAVWWNSFAL